MQEKGFERTKKYFLVATGQPNDRAIYYTNQESFHGGELWGNFDSAYRFESKQELLEYLSKISSFDLGRVIIVEIAEVTWDKCIQGYKDLWKGLDTEARNLYHKFNTVSYITNSARI